MEIFGGAQVGKIVQTNPELSQDSFEIQIIAKMGGFAWKLIWTGQESPIGK